MDEDGDEAMAEQEPDETAQIVEAERERLRTGGGIGVTIVHETSSPQIGSHALSGSSGVGDPGGGGMPIGVVVDGGTGEVVGTATLNPATGTAELPGTDTTVVEETSTPDASTPSAGGSSSDGVVEPAPTDTSGGSEATPDVGIVGPIDPNKFDFQDGPAANQQTSRCAEFGIAFRIAGKLVGTPVRVFIMITAPKQLASGEFFTRRRAAEISTVVVQDAAAVVVESLELGLIVPTEAPVKFLLVANEIFKALKQGFQGQQCFNKK